MRIYNLNKIPVSEFDIVGGKAKGLCLLSQTGLTIAPGFVLIDIQDETDIEKAIEHYKQQNLGKVAVRSSANAEDGVDFSNAGQYKTFLDVDGPAAFKDALIACLLSLDSAEAESYSTYFNQAKSTQMSVVIQQMVTANKAGVCFSEDPTGDKNNILVEAVNGLGENLVSGIVSAEQYKINRNEIDNITKQSGQLLTTQELKSICEDAIKATEYFEMPLDTEWAISEDGKLYWLQARPITTSDEIDIYELDSKFDWDQNVITNCNIGEMLPGAVTPLTLSTTVYAIDYGLRKMLTSAGVYKKVEDLEPYRCAVSVGNHLFLNLSIIYQLGDYVLGADKNSMELSICGRELGEKPEASFLPVIKISFFSKIVNGLKYARFLLSRNKVRKRLEKLAKEYKFSHKGTVVEQYNEIDKDLHLITEGLSLHYVTSAHSGAMSSALFVVINEEIKDAEKTRSIIANLLENIENIESVDILRSLLQIASALKEEKFDSKSLIDSELLHYLRSSNTKSHKMYQAFMNKHGHRAIREAEMSSKGWEQDDTGFVAYLRTVINSENSMRIKGNRTSHIVALEQLRQQFKGSKMKAISYFVKQARIGVVNRESSKSSSIRLVNEFKIAYNGLGQLMVENNLLPDSDLLYFLTHDEIGSLVNDNNTSLVKKALQRKRLFEEQKMLKFKDVHFGKPKAEEISLESIESGDLLQGSPVSRGIARGRVRIVKTIEDANKLQKGEIMVASFTDIGWSPYYSTIEALITEIGSALSHGAVVAREYSLPLITNVTHATIRLQNGDIITVNANLGTIIREQDTSLN